MDKLQIERWHKRYNYKKYPVKVYEEIVTGRLINAQSMLIMGAWKTGNLRENLNGQDYVDNLGIGYSFKQGWEKSHRAYYNGWKFMQDNFDALREIIPPVFPEKEPEIMYLLKKQTGIGFVYAAFFLHCCFPNIYPLYDQHVYRAYEYERSSGNNIVKAASNKWDSYFQYKKYFDNLVKTIGVEPSIVDRALWTYGKSIKMFGKNSSYKEMNILKDNKLSIKKEEDELNWKRISTLARNSNNIAYKKVQDKYDIIWSKISFELKESDIEIMLNEFFKLKEKWYALGASETNPTPNGFGEYLALQFPSYTSRHASAIAAVLVDIKLLEAKVKKSVWLRRLDN